MNWQPATAFVGDKGHPLLGGGFLLHIPLNPGVISLLTLLG